MHTQTPLKKLLILASGESHEEAGGSGFKNLVLLQRTGFLRANIVGVVSNHSCGGVYSKAQQLKIPFYHLRNKDCTAEGYQRLVEKTCAQHVTCSGWLRPVRGLDPTQTTNVHPAPLPLIGGMGCHGDKAHEMSLAARTAGTIESSAVSMHFVTDYDESQEQGYDTGPMFFQFPVAFKDGDTVATLKARVNAAEHIVQPIALQFALDGLAHWDGKDPSTLVTPFPINN